MASITYSICPVCQQNQLRFWKTVKDHSVSGEAFKIDECHGCSARVTQTVPDQASIGRYYASGNYVSHTDTRKGLIFQLYHWVRSITLRSKRNLLFGLNGRKNGNILDVGAGTGAFLNEMRKSGWQVTGLEPDAGARAVALKNYQLALLEAHHLFQLEAEKYDIVTMWHVLEHVHDLQGYMARLATLLKERGKLVIAVPNYTSKDAQHYDTAWAAYDVPRHLYHFSPAAIRKLAVQHQMEVTTVKPMWFDSFYVSMLSETYRNGKSNHLAAFFQGLRSNFAALSNKERASSLIYILQKIN